MATILFPMPYAALSSKTLSLASRRALERALKVWWGSFQTKRAEMILILSAFDDDYETELWLEKELLREFLADKKDKPRLLILPAAKNEEELALKLRQALKEIRPVENIVVFAESLHALHLKPIFLRRFGALAEFRTFKGRFESRHPWIFAFTPVWFLRNIVCRLWFGAKKHLKGRFRKSLRRLFWS